MTIEELKARHHNAASNPGDGASISIEEAGFAGPWCMLFHEILTLVDAAQDYREHHFINYEPATGVVDALDAFNAKLRSMP